MATKKAAPTKAGKKTGKKAGMSMDKMPMSNKGMMMSKKEMKGKC